MKKIDNLKNSFLQSLDYRLHMLYIYSGILFCRTKTNKHLGFIQEKSVMFENFSDRPKY